MRLTARALEGVQAAGIATAQPASRQTRSLVIAAVVGIAAAAVAWFALQAIETRSVASPATPPVAAGAGDRTALATNTPPTVVDTADVRPSPESAIAAPPVETEPEAVTAAPATASNSVVPSLPVHAEQAPVAVANAEPQPEAQAEHANTKPDAVAVQDASAMEVPVPTTPAPAELAAPATDSSATAVHVPAEDDFAMPAAAPLVIIDDDIPEERAGTVRKQALAATISPEQELADLIETLRAEGLNPDLRAKLRAYIEQHPDNILARETYATELLRGEERKAAERVLEDGLQITPHESRLATMLAHLLLERGEVESALEVLGRATPRPDRSGAEHLAFAAALHQRLGQHREAIAHYKRALEVLPRRGAWWIGLGISLSADSRPALARTAFQRSLDDRDLSRKMRSFANAEISRLSGLSNS